MDKTYMTMMQGETRAVALTIRDDSNAPYYPDTATSYVVELQTDENTVTGNVSDSTVVVASESPCMIIANTIYSLINPTVTAYPGRYEIIWKITKTAGLPSTYAWYHKTELYIEEL